MGDKPLFLLCVLFTRHFPKTFPQRHGNEHSLRISASMLSSYSTIMFFKGNINCDSNLNMVTPWLRLCVYLSSCHFNQQRSGSRLSTFLSSRCVSTFIFLLEKQNSKPRTLNRFCYVFFFLLFRYLAKLSSVGSIRDEETCERLRGLIQRQVCIFNNGQ